MKTFLMIAGVVVVIVLAAAGGFWGGMQYQTAQVDAARANFENARGPLSGLPEGGFPNGQAPDRQQFQGGGAQGGFIGRGGTAGSVKSVDGNTLSLSTAQDVTTVNLSEATVVQMTVTGGLEDLLPGVRVMVAGERNEDGSIDATQITILQGDAFLPGAPAATQAP